MPVSQETVDRLRSIVGEAHVVTGAAQTEPYSHDETEDLHFAPDAVVRPRTTDEVSRILAHAHETGIPVTPRGGGTGLSGGALPVRGGIVLSLERMDAILEVDPDNFYARVEAGIVVERFQDEMEKLGLFYPPDPASRGSCMIGGNVAENSGGPRAVKYGVTRNYVLALKGCLADGTVFSWGAPVLKNVSGYDLVGMLCGSEGTLVVVTECTLRLLPRPGMRRMLLAPFAKNEDATRTVAEIYRRGGNPSALEFLEADAVDASERHLGEKWPVEVTGCCLLIELDAPDEASLDRDTETVAAILEEAGAADCILADDSAKMARLWRLRRSVGEAVKAVSVYKEEDTVVPRAKLPELYRRIREIEARHGIASVCYGHAGDGNIHCNILKRDLPDAEWESRLPLFIRDLFTAVVDLGGAITGEHGVGYTQREYLPIGVGDPALDIMRRVKHALDPKGILNPGKIFRG